MRNSEHRLKGGFYLSGDGRFPHFDCRIMTEKGESSMRRMEFTRVAVGDWERPARGVLYSSHSGIEIVTENKSTRKFFTRSMAQGHIVSNPVVWAGGRYHTHEGSYQVIHVDDEGIVMKPVKVRVNN